MKKDKVNLGADFKLLLFGNTVSLMGTNVSVLAIPWFVLSITDSPFYVSLVYALEFIPAIFLSIPIGSLIDGIDRKKLMSISGFICFAIVLFLSTMIYFQSVSFFLLCILILLLNTFALIFNSANASSLPNLVSKEYIHRANSTYQMYSSIGTISGPAIGGFLISIMPIEMVFLLDAITYLVSFLCIFLIRKPFQTKRNLSVKWFEMFDGIKFIIKNSYLLLLSLFTLFSNFINNAVYGVLTFHLAKNLDWGSERSGIVLGAWGVGLLLGAIINNYSEAQIKSGTLLTLSRFVSFLAPLLYFTSNSFILYTIASMFTGLGMVLFNIQSSSFRQIYTPDNVLGRVTTANLMISRIAIPLGSAAGGAFATLYQVKWLYMIASIIQMILLILVIITPLSKLGIRSEIIQKKNNQNNVTKVL